MVKPLRLTDGGSARRQSGKANLPDGLGGKANLKLARHSLLQSITEFFFPSQPQSFPNRTKY
jgi:hypothetical protein